MRTLACFTGTETELSLESSKLSYQLSYSTSLYIQQKRFLCSLFQAHNIPLKDLPGCSSHLFDKTAFTIKCFQYNTLRGRTIPRFNVSISYICLTFPLQTVFVKVGDIVCNASMDTPYAFPAAEKQHRWHSLSVRCSNVHSSAHTLPIAKYRHHRVRSTTSCLNFPLLSAYAWQDYDVPREVGHVTSNHRVFWINQSVVCRAFTVSYQHVPQEEYLKFYCYHTQPLISEAKTFKLVTEWCELRQWKLSYKHTEMLRLSWGCWERLEFCRFCVFSWTR